MKTEKLNLCKKVKNDKPSVELQSSKDSLPVGVMYYFIGDCPKGWDKVREVDEEELNKLKRQAARYGIKEKLE